MNAAPADPSVPRPPRLLDQLRDRLRLKHFSLRAERAYAQWVKRYTCFRGKRHPVERRLREVAQGCNKAKPRTGWRCSVA